MIFLHILLSILKWIGIILLAILCILLFLILLVLLMPIRYRADAEKRTEDFKDTKLSARVSWFFSALSFTFQWVNGESTMILHIFGHSPEEYAEFIHNFGKKKEKAPLSSENRESVSGEPSRIEGTEPLAIEQKANSEETEPEDAPGPEPEQPVKAETGSEAAESRQEKTTESTEKENTESVKAGLTDSGTENPKRLDINKLRQKISDKISEFRKKKDKPAEPEKTDSGSRSEVKVSLKNRLEALRDTISEKIFTTLRAILVKIGHFLIKLPTWIGMAVMNTIRIILTVFMEILGFPIRLFGIPDLLRSKFSNIMAKADKVLAFLKTEDGHKLLIHLKKEIFKILRIVLPGKLRGDLTIGCGDPSMTGQIYGGYVMLRAWRGDKNMREFSFEPDFEQFIVEGTIGLAGSIMLGSLVLVAIRLLLDPKVWKAIKVIKSL